MRGLTEQDLAAYLDTYFAKSQLQNPFFRAVIISVKPYSRGGYICRLIRSGDVVSDQGDYLCVIPGYLPQVGDDVECMYRDKGTAWILWPVTRTSTGAIIQQVRTKQGDALVTFSNIPQNFTDLEITYYGARDTSAASALLFYLIRFNGDAVAAHYYNEEINIQGATSGVSEILGAVDLGARAGITVNGNLAAPLNAAGRIEIFGYADPSPIVKSVLWEVSARYGTATNQTTKYEGASTWLSAAAPYSISRIDLLIASFAWAAGGVFTLRGK